MKRLLSIVIFIIVAALILGRFGPVSGWFHGIAGKHEAVNGKSKSCRIKGNINEYGEKIYHVPGQPYYDVTRIDKYKGERWFCTEAAARAAGWRKGRGY